MDNIITLNHVTKKFKQKEVVFNVNMNIKKGEIYGFLGENGAGKTTIMKMILNLIKPTQGEILVENTKIEEKSFKYLKNIGSIIEYPVFYERLTAYENLKLHCAYCDVDAKNIEETLRLVGLEGKGELLTSEFSLGMKQRLGIARAIVTKPQILILDEPINGLDPIGIKDIRLLLLKLKKEWGVTILISSHIVSEIESIADRIGIIHKGQIKIEIPLREIQKNNVSLEEYFLNHLEEKEEN